MKRIVQVLGRIGFALFGGIIAAAWTSLLAAELSHFHPLFGLCAGAAVTVAVFIALMRRKTERYTADWTLLAAIAIAIFSFLLTLPPSEWILGGWDPGVYVHSAAMIARTGTLQFDQPDLATLHGKERDLLARDLYGVVEPFGGMRVIANGRISPQFYHLYPSLMALVWGLGGVRAALLVNAVLNAGSILLMYAWVSRLLNRRWGLGAAITLALIPSQIWQAQFPTSEMLTQFLLLGAFTMLKDSLHPGRRIVEPILAGLAFGAALLTRYDTMILLLPFGFVLSLGFLDREKRPALLMAFGVAALLAVHVWLHQHFVAPLYKPLQFLVAKILRLGPIALVIWLGAAAAVRRSPALEWLRKRQNVWRAAAAILFIGWCVFAWYIRPRLTMDGSILGFVRFCFPGFAQSKHFEFLAGTQAYNMTYLESIFGRAGLFIGLGGIVAMIFRRKDLASIAWLASSIAVMVVLVTNVFNDQFLMWVSRRFAPVVVPLVTVGLVTAAAEIQATLRRWWPAASAWSGGGLLAVVLAANVESISAMTTLREWPGLIAWYESFEYRIPADALVYCDQRGFAAPLRFIYGKKAFEMHSYTPERRSQLLELMKHKARHHQVMFLTMEKSGLEQARFLVPVKSAFLRSSVLANYKYSIPFSTRERGGDFVLYRVVPPPGDTK